MHADNTSRSGRPEVVLLTGASGGLGLALAQSLQETDYHVLLTAREPSIPLLHRAGFRESERLWIEPLDVTDPAQRQAVIAAAEKRWGGVDVLINNAGIAYRTVVEHFSERDFHHVMNVNFFGPMDLIRRVLPRMRERRSGRILSVSSVGGMMAMPTMALYSASKFALEGACEALWYEVRPWNIHVSLIQPGFVRSHSFENTLYTEESRAASESPENPYHGHYIHMTQLIARLMNRSRASPEYIARQILQVLRARQPHLRIGVTPDARFFALLRRLLPRRLYHCFLYRQLPGIDAWGRAPLGD